jgi:hypothetical protein
MEDNVEWANAGAGYAMEDNAEWANAGARYAMEAAQWTNAGAGYAMEDNAEWAHVGARYAMEDNAKRIIVGSFGDTRPLSRLLDPAFHAKVRLRSKSA